MKKKTLKKIKASSRMGLKLGVYAVAGFLIVQGALALFPKITGTTSIVIGFVLVTLMGLLEATNKI